MNNNLSPIRITTYQQQNSCQQQQQVGKQMPQNVSFERPISQTQGLQQIQLNGYNFSSVCGNNLSSSSQPKGSISESPQRMHIYQQQIINNQAIKLEAIGVQKDNITQLYSYHHHNGYLQKKKYSAAKRHLSSQLSQKLFTQEIKGLNPSHNIFCDQQKGNQLRTSANHVSPQLQKRINGFQQSVLQNKILSQYNSNANASLITQQKQQIDIFARSTYFVRPIQELVHLNMPKPSFDPNLNAIDQYLQQGYDELSPKPKTLNNLNQQQINLAVNKSLTLEDQSQFTLRNSDQILKQEKRDYQSVNEEQQLISSINRKLHEDQQILEEQRYQRAIFQPTLKTEVSAIVEQDRFEGLDNSEITTNQYVKNEKSKTKIILKYPNDTSFTESKRPLKQTELFRISSPLKFIKSNAQFSNPNGKMRSISQDPQSKHLQTQESALKQMHKEKEQFNNYQMLLN